MWVQGCRGIVNILQGCDKVVTRLQGLHNLVATLSFLYGSLLNERVYRLKNYVSITLEIKAQVEPPS